MTVVCTGWLSQASISIDSTLSSDMISGGSLTLFVSRLRQTPLDVFPRVVGPPDIPSLASVRIQDVHLTSGSRIAVTTYEIPYDAVYDIPCHDDHDADLYVCSVCIYLSRPVVYLPVWLVAFSLLGLVIPFLIAICFAYLCTYRIILTSQYFSLATT